MSNGAGGAGGWPFGDICVGSCGFCGSEVLSPMFWAGDASYVPRVCRSCKAVAAHVQPLPVLAMVPRDASIVVVGGALDGGCGAGGCGGVTFKP